MLLFQIQLRLLQLLLLLSPRLLRRLCRNQGCSCHSLPLMLAC